LASRLETSAESGQIVIGATTYAYIRDIAVVRELGGIAVKGKAAPVEAFVLLGLRQTSIEQDAAEDYRMSGAGGATADRPAADSH
jgi:class 3 adenylate cyclase